MVQGLQAAAAAGGSRSSTVSMNKSLNAAMIGEALPRGRGVDERAVRAAASVRKKADARRHAGSQVTPVQPPVVSQLLNIRSPTTIPKSKDNGKGDNQRKGIPSVVSAEDLVHDNVQGEQPYPASAPVGLGKGLASLDVKKQKNKPNVES